MNAFDAIYATIREDIQLPRELDHALMLFRKGHLYFKTFRKMQYLKSNENALIYGTAVHLISDYSQLLKLAVTITLMVKCTQDLMREHRLLREHVHSFNKARRWEYPVYKHIEWKKNTLQIEGRMETGNYLNLSISPLLRQIALVARCSLTVFWQGIKVSMYLNDAYLLLNGDTQARYDGCTEIFGQWTEYKKQLQGEKKLLEEIIKSSNLVQRLLNNLGLKNSYSAIVDNLTKKTIEVSEHSGGFWNDVYEAGRSTLYTFFIPGKITPPRINLAEGDTAAPAIPYCRYPPWRGQEMGTHFYKKDEGNIPFTPNDFASNNNNNTLDKYKEWFAQKSKNVSHYQSSRAKDSAPFT